MRDTPEALERLKIKKDTDFQPPRKGLVLSVQVESWVAQDFYSVFGLLLLDKEASDPFAVAGELAWGSAVLGNGGDSVFSH